MREHDFVDECYADKDLSLLKKLTLVIPTYNRNYYLSRCLWYHAHFPFGEIIVADSSPEEKKVVNRETVVKVREKFGANIRYLEYEPETEKYGGDIYRKWGEAVQHVETEYSQVVTDKEFLIPTTLSELISFLINHNTFVVASGREYKIISDSNNSEKNAILRLHECYSNHRVSELSSDSYERFIHALNIPIGNGSLLLALTKTNVHKDIHKLIFEYNIGDIKYGEIVLGYTAYLIGKTYYNPNLIYKIRDTIYIECERRKAKLRIIRSSESSASRYYDLGDYKHIPETKKFKESYSKYIHGEIQKYTDYNSDDVEKLLPNLFSSPLYHESCENRFIRIIIKNGANLYELLQIYYKLPRPLKLIIRKLGLIFGIDIPTASIKIEHIEKYPETSIIKIMIHCNNISSHFL